MLSQLALYLRLGFHHIADFAGYDHILFVTALAIPYTFRNWKRLAVLVTAFTAAHSITLVVATLRMVAVSPTMVEALIPATIIVTVAMSWRSSSPGQEYAPITLSRYLMASAFGLIHGLGFSTYLRALLGEEERITLPLLAFNVGLEFGQLLILAVVLLAGVVLVPRILSRRRWVLVQVGVTGGLALLLLGQRLFAAR
ncbi:HupE/UreJ family protein [Gemmatimonas sp.]|uniref:HupE/UreJ family protein n=1 Tax=Gemmatimonas sp. TaxID=1962908 RepID=UPI00333FDE8D